MSSAPPEREAEQANFRRQMWASIANGRLTFLPYAWLPPDWLRIVEHTCDANKKLGLPLAVSSQTGAVVLKAPTSDRGLPPALHEGDMIVGCGQVYFNSVHGPHSIYAAASKAQPHSKLPLVVVRGRVFDRPPLSCLLSPLSTSPQSDALPALSACLGVNLVLIQVPMVTGGGSVASSASPDPATASLVQVPIVVGLSSQAGFVGQCPSLGDMLVMVNGKSLVRPMASTAPSTPPNLILKDALRTASDSGIALTFLHPPLSQPHHISPLPQPPSGQGWLPRLVQQLWAQLASSRPPLPNVSCLPPPAPVAPVAGPSMEKAVTKTKAPVSADIAPPATCSGTVQWLGALQCSAGVRLRAVVRLRKRLGELTQQGAQAALKRSTDLQPSTFCAQRNLPGRLVHAFPAGVFGTLLQRDGALSAEQAASLLPCSPPKLPGTQLSAKRAERMVHAAWSTLCSARASVRTALKPKPGHLASLKACVAGLVRQSQLAPSPSLRHRKERGARIALALRGQQLVSHELVRQMQALVEEGQQHHRKDPELRRRARQLAHLLHEQRTTSQFCGQPAAAMQCLGLPGGLLEAHCTFNAARVFPAKARSPPSIHTLLRAAASFSMPSLERAVGSGAQVQEAAEAGRAMGEAVSIARSVIASLSLRTSLRKAYVRLLPRKGPYGSTIPPPSPPLPSKGSVPAAASAAGGKPPASVKTSKTLSVQVTQRDLNAFTSSSALGVRHAALSEAAGGAPTEPGLALLSGKTRLANRQHAMPFGAGEAGAAAAAEVVTGLAAGAEDARSLGMFAVPPGLEAAGLFAPPGAEPKGIPGAVEVHRVERAPSDTSAASTSAPPGTAATSTIGVLPTQRRAVRAVLGHDLHDTGYDSEEERLLPTPGVGPEASQADPDAPGSAPAPGNGAPLAVGPWAGKTEGQARAAMRARAARASAVKAGILVNYASLVMSNAPAAVSGASVHVAADGPPLQGARQAGGGRQLLHVPIKTTLSAPEDEAEPPKLVLDGGAINHGSGRGETDSGKWQVVVKVPSVALAEPAFKRARTDTSLKAVGATMAVHLQPLSLAQAAALAASDVPLAKPGPSPAHAAQRVRRWNGFVAQQLLSGVWLDADTGLALPALLGPGLNKAGSVHSAIAAVDNLRLAVASKTKASAAMPTAPKPATEGKGAIATGSSKGQGGEASQQGAPRVPPFISAAAVQAQRRLLGAAASTCRATPLAYASSPWWDAAAAALGDTPVDVTLSGGPGRPGVPNSPAELERTMLGHLSKLRGAGGAMFSRAGAEYLRITGAGGRFPASSAGSAPFGLEERQLPGMLDGHPALPLPAAPEGLAAKLPLDPTAADPAAAAAPLTPSAAWWDEATAAALQQLDPSWSRSGVEAQGASHSALRRARPSGGSGGDLPPAPRCAKPGCEHPAGAMSKYCTLQCGIDAARRRVAAALAFAAQVPAAVLAEPGAAGSTAAGLPAAKATGEEAGSAAQPDVTPALAPTVVKSSDASSSPAAPLEALTSGSIAATAAAVLGLALEQVAQWAAAEVAALFALPHSSEAATPLPVPIAEDGFVSLPPVRVAGVAGGVGPVGAEAAGCNLLTWLPVGDASDHGLDPGAGAPNRRRPPPFVSMGYWEHTGRLARSASDSSAAPQASAPQAAAAPPRKRGKKRTRADAHKDEEPQLPVSKASSSCGTASPPVTPPPATQSVTLAPWVAAEGGLLMKVEASLTAMEAFAVQSQCSLEEGLAHFLKQALEQPEDLYGRCQPACRTLSASVVQDRSRRCAFPAAFASPPPSPMELLSAWNGHFQTGAVEVDPLHVLLRPEQNDGSMMSRASTAVAMCIESTAQRRFEGTLQTQGSCVPEDGLLVCSTHPLKPSSQPHAGEPDAHTSSLAQLPADTPALCKQWIACVSDCIAASVTASGEAAAPSPGQVAVQVQHLWEEACAAVTGLDQPAPRIRALIAAVCDTLKEDVCQSRVCDCAVHGAWDQSLPAMLRGRALAWGASALSHTLAESTPNP